jgi:hypothetical protein
MAKEPILCPLRCRAVSSLPEERVRVRLIEFLLQAGYPKSGLVIEKALAQMPHLANCAGPLPLRRADLVSFVAGIHPEEGLYPLILFECKGVPLTERMKKQVTGYNHFLGAYFVSLINQASCWLGWLDSGSGEYRWITHLPRFGELMTFLKQQGRIR